MAKRLLNITDQIKSYFEPSTDGVRVRDFARELPGAVAQLATFYGDMVKPPLQGIAKIPFRLGASLAEIPRDLASPFTGNVPFQPFNVPGLGKIKTYGRESVDLAQSGGSTPLFVAAGIAKGVGMGAGDLATVGGLGQLATGDKATSLFTKGNVVQPTPVPSTGKSVLNAELANEIDNVNVLDAVRKYPDSFEALSEQANGWEEGIKELFDTAIQQGDKLTVKALLNQNAVPPEYLKTFSNEINKVLGVVR